MTMNVVFSGLAGLAVGLALQFLLGAYCRVARLSLRLLQRRRTQGRQHVQVSVISTDLARYRMLSIRMRFYRTELQSLISFVYIKWRYRTNILNYFFGSSVHLLYFVGERHKEVFECILRLQYLNCFCEQDISHI